MPEPDQTRIQAFQDPTTFWEWLALNHASEPEVWVKIRLRSKNNQLGGRCDRSAVLGLDRWGQKVA